jgi:hypothetical protein
MKITYVIALEDYRQMLLFHFANSSRFRKSRRFLHFFPPLPFLLLAGFFVFDHASKSAIFPAVFASVWLLLFPFYQRWQYNRSAKGSANEHHRDGVGQPVTLELQENQIVEHHLGIETRAAYDSIVEITETKNHIFIWLKTSAVFLIPKAKTPNSDQFASKLKEMATLFQLKYEEVKQ